MRFSFSAIAFAAVLAFANAQSISDIPSCALSCFLTAIPAAGCSVTDTLCQCTTGKDKITDSITACVPSKCSADDIAKIAPVVAGLCAKQGVTVTDLPTAASTGGSASRSTAVTGSGSPTTTGSGAASTQSTGAATANGVTFGLAAGLMGVAAWL